LHHYLARQTGQDNRNMRAPPFRRDRTMASDTIAKLCSLDEPGFCFACLSSIPQPPKATRQRVHPKHTSGSGQNHLWL
jgi:hypothetical protein